MHTLNYQRFTNLPFLLSIKPQRLREFLEPFHDYLSARQLHLDQNDLSHEEYVQRLSEVFASPDADTPSPLLDALHVVNGLTGRATIDLLFDQIDGLIDTFQNEDDPFPGDVAIEAFLRDRDRAERMLSHHSAQSRRAFASFQSQSSSPPKLVTDLAMGTRTLTRDLDQWFYRRGCGRGAAAQCNQNDGSLYVFVSHGTPMRRLDVLEQGLPESLICRPLKHDVAVFDKLIGELRINAETIPQREIYRRLIGKHLFGNEEMFPPGEKFTLGPLLEYGEAALSVAMIEELTSVECHSVKMLLPGHKPEELTSRRQDVLEVLEQRMQWLARQGYEDIRLTEAKFNLLFASSRRSRVVTIKPPNVAIYSRDGDSEIVERFLRDRGFITEQDWQPYAIDGAVLAGS
ncbi:hypothetical protein [Rhodopirellula halodulae]|uniref:hypothetical protein n=1 Tax=Rhodopirellula halodulae TaxID=2894198 RepID=UPI001E60EFDA|nr:hypothetical protein [Rhodopirellula sp. JC737]MCC9654665.1 hypothetical protein [Rhodopirellula sp. JC737]